MSVVKATSEGTLATTRIDLDGQAIDPGNLIAFQLYYEPQIPQVGCEFEYVDVQGKLARWSGVNQDDAFSFVLIDDTSDRKQTLKLEAALRGVRMSILHEQSSQWVGVLPGATLVLVMKADCWTISLNKTFEKVSRQAYVAAIEGTSDAQ